MPGRTHWNPQAAAARVLARVSAEGRFLDTALEEELAGLPAPMRGKAALIQEMCYGTMREWLRLEAIAGAYLERPVKDETVHALLLLGLYQLRAMRAPAHTAVAETVEAAAHLERPWARGLLNACLRASLRDPARGGRALAADLPAQHAHPPWLIEAARAAFPGDWEAVLAANNARAPFTLRVNTTRITRAQYVARLSAAGIAAAPAPCTESGLALAQPRPVERLPGFAEGLVSVQDAAAQLAAAWLDAPPGARVLDACAAPGGKSAHLLERTPGIELTALDIDRERAARLGENLARLGLAAHVRVADAAEPAGWWDGRAFDAILLDAPCSASGVIRRHPDIKLRRRPGDLAALADSQRRLLEALWPTLRPGGKLLYVTCSILPDENELRIGEFLARHTDAREQPLPASAGRPRTHGRQILPGESCGDGGPSMDGFYYACLEKR
jgi:16S rRNA (cytosine967-C5)-methyltransferase